ncbi:hypothetical protein HMSSN036_94530 [Paenibacillus macerans]|uniref:Uncharacterized protein n=1 Tax=Paenibacillus macerans TaxID=44252 RepID=A0A090Z7B1_PAEMA|nr:hypothetical protein [Paenibacillus macerans]KFN06527.1 hypothetical protein DJ90_4176 [Paenibacillus macerans]MBS5909097.1 hypothetical protein [Paenibacillus macerans]MCY7558111.1 hypothetical protein [Paenibacillus macerans]MDU5949861.1 hypothetical protein [Paenibacillus macerans]MDU7475186.1 hypothetical protein [Paenibacillus macerans]
MAEQKRKLTNDPEELLKAKHAEDEHKQQFTNFAHSVTGGAEAADPGKVVGEEHREPDTQNYMKTVENRMLE